MHSVATLIIQFVFTGLFLVVVGVGIYGFKNREKFFGANLHLPGESDGARTYSKAVIVLVWVHALVLTGAFALFLH
jgi:hypothetical protein